MTVAELQTGDIVTIINVSNCSVGIQLMELGFIKNVNIEYLGKCPFGSCLRIKFLHSVVGIRKETASLIEVAPIVKRI